MPPLPNEVQLRSWYVDRGWSIREITEQTGIPYHRIQTALAAHGITRRRSGWVDGQPPPPITLVQLQQLYVTTTATLAETAIELSVTPEQVRTALKRHQLPIRRERRPVTPAPLTLEQLHELYVVRQLSDGEIADEVGGGFLAWHVRLRRRELGIVRGAAERRKPPARPAPAAAVLRELYETQGRTLSQVGRHFSTSAPAVKAWLLDAGIKVKPRTTRQTRHRLDPAQIRELYEERLWTSGEIAAHLDTSPHLVLRTLHENDVPVRIGPARRPARTDGVLSALYADPEVVAMLRRHHVPRRQITGGIAQRFPAPIPLTAGLLHDAYQDIGLSSAHIEMLTGQPHEQILDALRTHDIEVRPLSTFSPWLVRQRGRS